MDTTPIRQWKFDAKDQDGVQVGGEIEAFIKATGLDDVASGRISRLLVLPLFGATKASVVDPLKVGGCPEFCVNGLVFNAAPAVLRTGW